MTTETLDNPLGGDLFHVVRRTVRETHPDGSIQILSRSLVRAPGSPVAVYLKALVLANARHGADIMEQPYDIEIPPVENPQAQAWYDALSEESATISFRRGKEGYKAFRDLVEPIDFNSYDPELAAEIRALYTVV